MVQWFQMKVSFKHNLESGGRLGENPRCFKSSVTFLQSVMIRGAVSPAGGGDGWSAVFYQSKVNTALYQEISDDFLLPSADNIYGDDDFLFQLDLAPAHSAKTSNKWCGMSDWAANFSDLNPTENLWFLLSTVSTDDENHPAQKNRGSQGCYQTNTSALLEPDPLHATPHWCSTSSKRS